MWDTFCSKCVWPIWFFVWGRYLRRSPTKSKVLLAKFPGTELHLKVAFVCIQSWFHLSMSFFHGPPNCLLRYIRAKYGWISSCRNTSPCSYLCIYWIYPPVIVTNEQIFLGFRIRYMSKEYIYIYIFMAYIYIYMYTPSCSSSFYISNQHLPFANGPPGFLNIGNWKRYIDMFPGIVDGKPLLKQ